MSIETEITRIKTNISNAYTKAEEKGATLPEVQNSENLASTIENIIEKDIDYWQSHPIEYWNLVRPKEYPVLPDPNENEIYITVQIDKSDYNYFGFLVNTYSGNYVVEIGDIVNGEFIAESTEEVVKNTQYTKLFDSVEKITYKVFKITAEGDFYSFQLKDTDLISITYQKYLDLKANIPLAKNIVFGQNRNLENIYLILNSVNNGGQGIQYDYNLKSRYIKYLDWSKFTYPYSLFRYNNVKSINLPEISCNATNMAFFMNGSSSLRKIDLSNFNVDNCTNFAQCCSQNYNTEEIIGMENWNTSSVTNMGSMFFNCYILKDLTSIENWNTSSVTDMSNMFSGCQSLNKLDLSNWDLSSVTNMSNMFQNCYKLTDFNISKIPCSTSFNNDFNLSHDSLLNILNALVDYSDNSNTYTLTLGATNLAKLTEEEIAIGTNKGWTIS